MNVVYLSNIMKLKNFKINFISALFITGFISATYFYGIARQRFIVESEFAVRQSGPSTLDSGISSLFGGFTTRSLEDLGYLRVYLKSIEVMEASNNVIDIDSSYLRNSWDPYSGIGKKSTIEDKSKLFKRIISINIDIDTGILTLKTIGYDPKTAFNLNEFLIAKSEEFVNKINYDINKKQLNFATKERLKSKKRVDSANEALINFQESNQLLDINSEVKTSNNLIAALELELSKKKVNLATIKRKFIDPNDPEIIFLTGQIEELKKQIANERILLVSPEGKALNKKSSDLERLESQLKLAIALDESTQTSIEQTRVDSIRQQRFLALMSKPIYPEKEWIFWRHKSFITTILIFLIGYVLIKFILGMTDNEEG